MYELLKLKKKPPKEVFGWKLFTAKKSNSQFSVKKKGVHFCINSKIYFWAHLDQTNNFSNSVARYLIFCHSGLSPVFQFV